MINKIILQKQLGKHKGHRISEKEFYEAYKIFFGTLVSEPRLKIINILRNKKKNVSELIGELNMDQTLVSHNLARLKKCGFVLSEINGKFRYYKLNEKTILPLMNIIDSHMSKYCIHILNKGKVSVRKP